MRAVLEWLTAEGVSPADISAYVGALQQRFLDSAHVPGELLPPVEAPRGNFLTFRTDNAEKLYNALHDQGVITDYRYDRLRFGFGVYHDDSDVDRLVEVLRTAL